MVLSFRPKEPLIFHMKYLLTLLLVLVFLSCSNNKSEISPFIDTPPPGFPAERTPEGPLMWQKSPNILSQYKNYNVPPVIVELRDSGRALPVNNTEIDDLGESLRTKIIRGLGSEHTIFTQPVKGFAVVKVKLLNVWSERALLNVVPGARSVNPLSGGATMQADIVDAVSGEVVAKIWDSRAVSPKTYLAGFDKWSGTEATFDDWARIISNRLVDRTNMQYQATSW